MTITPDIRTYILLSTVCYGKETVDSVYTHFSIFLSLVTEIITDKENGLDKRLQFEKITVTETKKSTLHGTLLLLRFVADAMTQHVSDSGWGLLFLSGSE